MSESICTILYHESRSVHNQDLLTSETFPSDMVSVQARRWNGPEANDVVVQVQVRVDGEDIVNSRNCRDGLGCTNAEVQREAIAAFDNLLANHPTLGKSNGQV